MNFYIVTPSYQALSWLKRCVRSVADQVGGGVQVHHHIQDGGSSDGAPEWLALWKNESQGIPGYAFSYESCRDGGMYDAINRAWERLPHDAQITAHLNCDEQFLPGALKQISVAMEQKPEADIALGTYIIIDNHSRYICHRRPIMPHLWTSQTVCEIITCSCFHRVPSFKRHGIRFDTRWKSIADVFFYRDIVQTKPSILLLPDLITSCFTVTGHNLAWSGLSRREWEQAFSSYPWHISHRHRFANRWCNLKRFLRDLRCQPPASYDIYLPEAEERTRLLIHHPTCHWGCRTEGES